MMKIGKFPSESDIYTIVEKQNEGSYREGEQITAKNLSSAKRQASRYQFFKGTVLEIRQGGTVLSVKKDGVWNDR